MRVLSRRVTPQMVRAAVPADAAALALLCAAHAAFERLPYSPTGHVQRLHDALAQGHMHAWLWEQNGMAMGYASVTLEFATLSGQRFAHLDCLYLEPAARHQGGGHALMQAVQAHARAHGCTEVQWQTPDWNHGAMRFYEGLGATAATKQRYTWVVGEAVDKST